MELVSLHCEPGLRSLAGYVELGVIPRVMGSLWRVSSRAVTWLLF